MYGFSKKCKLVSDENESTIGMAAQCMAHNRELVNAIISMVLFFILISFFLFRTLPIVNNLDVLFSKQTLTQLSCVSVCWQKYYLFTYIQSINLEYVVTIIGE